MRRCPGPLVTEVGMSAEQVRGEVRGEEGEEGVKVGSVVEELHAQASM